MEHSQNLDEVISFYFLLYFI